MRSILDRIYTLSGALSGALILGITLIIMAQIVGRWFGIVIPSTDDFSGFMLAASSFLGLAYTLKTGGHIRVSLVIQRLPARYRKLQEFFVLIVAVLLAIFMSWYLWNMVYESYIFEELSIGYIPVPLWIPQLPVSIGCSLFTIALIDELVCVSLGGRPTYQKHEEELSLEEL